MIFGLWQDAAARPDFLNIVARLEEATQSAAPESSVWLFIGREDFARFEQWGSRHPRLLHNSGGIHCQLRSIRYPCVATLLPEVEGIRQ